MMQAVATMVSLMVALMATSVIAIVLVRDWESVRAALRMAPAPVRLAPLPPRFRVTTVRRATIVRLVPPARVRVAI